MESLIQDLRVGFRNLGRQKGFALLAIGTLALGIGFNSAIFSVVNAVLLAPLDYPGPESLVWMFGRNSGNSQASISPPDFLDYSAQQDRFEAFAAMTGWPGVLSGAGRPERLSGAAVSDQFFEAMGIDPEAGRTWSAEDLEGGAARLVVLSHSLWQRRFGGDPSVVGRTLRLDGQAYTVMGVMPSGFGLLPPGFGLNRPADFWIPLDFQQSDMQVRRFHFLRVIGRLKEGQTVDSAQQQMDAIAARLEEIYPESNTGWGLNLVPLQQQLVSRVRPALLMLEGAVGLVLLIACANLASLLLARSAGRRQEMALRTALGAERRRLVRQMLTESLLLALPAGALGLLFSAWGLNAILSLSPSDIPRLDQIGVDQRVLGFTFGVSLLTGLLFGWLPALSASRTDLNQDLRPASRSPMAAGRGSGRTRGALVAAETALAVILLAGAGLLLKSFVRLQQVDPGFEFDNRLTLQITPSPSTSPDAEATARFYEQLLENVDALPGVLSAGLADRLPLLQPGSDTLFVPGNADPATSPDRQYALIRTITPGYFESMGIPLLQGRDFSRADTPDAPAGAVISSSLAEQTWPGENPIGKQMTIDQGKPVQAQVIGVVGSVRQNSLSAAPWQTMYLSFFQFPYPQSILNLAVRTDGDPLQSAGPVEAAIGRLDKEAAISSVQTLSTVLGESLSAPRFNLTLLSVFSMLALLLAALGIFGVMSQSVAQRRQEIGVRMALGAGRREVMRMVVRQGMRPALLGSLLGLAGALLLGQFVSSLLFEVEAYDPLTLAAVTALLLTSALLANLWPARRAGSVDPMHCLRCE